MTPPLCDVRRDTRVFGCSAYLSCGATLLGEETMYFGVALFGFLVFHRKSPPEPPHRFFCTSGSTEARRRKKVAISDWST